ncbi:MAG: Peptide deformylase [candidate division WS6 bacterium GW2011_GWF2_39_15]|uniref:Peptide deformylase n=1 Tax=candidate division WS6 bacterium GW2011_GWF2_39_15 TaxID=1619100 RepID=A0A0G0QWY6_9BACT|nr:MAG: Peptide deformylase [candidate division WS6 bacterium GW2011_GWF2_39_15]
MIKLLKVLTTDDDEKTLRMISNEIPMEEITSDTFHKFLDALKATAVNAELPEGWEPAGLAAIQVGVPKAVFISLDIDTGEFTEYINPKIKVIGDKQSSDLEGCLSLPGVTGYVKRPKKIKVTYLDRYGKSHTQRLSGFNSKIVQHEYDHLIGILFTDKLAK